MRSLILPLPFAALTILAWGSYGNWLHKSSHVFEGDASTLGVRQLFCVGMAYFVLAILIPVLFLQTKGEKGAFGVRGVIWSLAAGVCGVLGALGIIIALHPENHGSPIYVMPLVFGGAPVVNTLVSITINRSFKQVNSAFLAGIVLVAIGAALVFITKPKAEPSHASPKEVEQTEEASKSPTGTSDNKPADKDKNEGKNKAKTNWLVVMGGILLTALSWGTYGSVLHKGQAHMQGSRLRPLICVGLSYFVVAVIVPIALVQGNPLAGLGSASIWAFMAGVAGAIGAFGIILSFTFGGKPIYIMPLVFGGAPIINTLIASYGMYDKMSFMFISSLTIVIVGAVMVLVCQPKPAKPAPPPPEPSPAPEPQPKPASETEQDATDEAGAVQEDEDIGDS